MIPIQNKSDCPCHAVHQSPSARLFRLLEKVSAIALGTFCAYTNFGLFFSFLMAGTAIGFYQYFVCDPADVTYKSVSCSQGLLEQLTRVKLPPLVSLIANLAIILCHIEHHTTVFVPVISVSLGAWAGRSIIAIPASFFS